MDHLPDRPTWTCRACDNPWPCVTARLRLRTEYDGHSVPLMMYLNAQHVLAIGDIGEKVTAAELYRRFLGWVRADVL